MTGDKHIGSARTEPTEDTTTRVHVERANGESATLYLEPGNGFAVVDDGPVVVEAFATEDQ